MAAVRLSPPRDTDDDHVLDHEGRSHEASELFAILDVCPPHLIAGLDVERDDVVVVCPEVDVSVADPDTADGFHGAPRRSASGRRGPVSGRLAGFFLLDACSKSAPRLRR